MGKHLACSGGSQYSRRASAVQEGSGVRAEEALAAAMSPMQRSAGRALRCCRGKPCTPIRCLVLLSITIIGITQTYNEFRSATSPGK